MKTEHTGCEVPKWGLSSFLSSNARTSSYPELRSFEQVWTPSLENTWVFLGRSSLPRHDAGSFTPRLAEGNLWGRDLTHPEGFWRTLAQGHRHIQKGKICHI